MHNQKASSSAPLNPIHDSETPQKTKTSATDSSKSTNRKNNILTDPAFLASSLKRPTLKSSSKPDLFRDGSLTSQLSTEKIRHKPQLISLHKVSTP